MFDCRKKVDLKKLGRIDNLFLRELACKFIYEHKFYARSLEKMFGPEVPGNHRYAQRRNERVRQLRSAGVRVRNNAKSLYLNRISPGCLACTHWYRNGYLLDVAQSCNRKCFFCYHDSLPRVSASKQNEILNHLYADGTRSVFSIGNSEPLLAPQRVFASLQLVRKLVGRKCYTFLYTNGDLLTRDILNKLKENMLDEIRISIKPGESNLRPLIMAKAYIRNVMVEMPVFPGDETTMKRLLLELDSLNIFGINLSHLLFTEANKDKLRARGYTAVPGRSKPFYESFLPYELSADGGEETCFNVLEFAAAKKIKIGVHYCSNDNFRTSGLNMRLLQAQQIRKPYEIVTKFGLLKKLVVYSPDHCKAYEDLRGQGVPHSQIGLLAGKNRVETHIRNRPFLEKYEIGVVYSLPDGREVNVQILNPGRGLKGWDTVSEGAQKRLKNKIAIHIARIAILEQSRQSLLAKA